MWIDIKAQFVCNTAVVIVFLPQMLGILFPVINRLVAFWTMPVTVPFIIVQSPVGDLFAFTVEDHVIVNF